MKNKLKHLVPVLLALATITGSLSACELKPKAQQKVSKQGFYFDTIIQITLYGTTDEKYIDDCFDMAKKYEDMLDVYKRQIICLIDINCNFKPFFSQNAQRLVL